MDRLSLLIGCSRIPGVTFYIILQGFAEGSRVIIQKITNYWIMFQLEELFILPATSRARIKDEISTLAKLSFKQLHMLHFNIYNEQCQKFRKTQCIWYSSYNHCILCYVCVSLWHEVTQCCQNKTPLGRTSNLLSERMRSGADVC